MRSTSVLPVIQLLSGLRAHVRDADFSLMWIGCRGRDNHRWSPPRRSVRAPLRIRLLPRMDGRNADIKIRMRPCRTPGSRWDMPIPALCRAHVRLNDVLLGLRPSLPSLRGSLRFFVRPVHRYFGTVRLLLHVHVRRWVYGLHGPVLVVGRPRRTEDLPVLVHVVSQRARVLRLRRTEQPLSLTRLPVLPSSISEGSRHPDPSAFRSSIARPTGTSGLRFTRHLAVARARLEARMELLSPFL